MLRHRTGFCYAKSHLLAALLRANGIAAGLCYQRLSVNGGGTPYCLHGLNAVFLKDFGWYRVDARGNKPGIQPARHGTCLLAVSRTRFGCHLTAIGVCAATSELFYRCMTDGMPGIVPRRGVKLRDAVRWIGNTFVLVGAVDAR